MGLSVGDMATNLAGAVARGAISMAVIKASTPMPTTSPLSGGTDPAVKAMEATTNRAMDAALDAHQLAINTKQGLTDLVTRVSTVADMALGLIPS
jgi:tagatose-1,6-bisphosphate aldolase non-catalytic subunit AgaZ/GatZ